MRAWLSVWVAACLWLLTDGRTCNRYIAIIDKLAEENGVGADAAPAAAPTSDTEDLLVNLSYVPTLCLASIDALG